jgi:phosphoribosylformylglycinamidine cyclo-ligase
MAHITGGGITENVPRMLANNVQAVVELGSLSVPPLFRWLMEKGQIQEEDAFGTFNMGVGFVVAVSPSRLEEAMALLGQAGETPSVIGRLAERYPHEPHIRYEGKLA